MADVKVEELLGSGSWMSLNGTVPHPTIPPGDALSSVGADIVDNILMIDRRRSYCRCRGRRDTTGGLKEVDVEQALL